MAARESMYAVLSVVLVMQLVNVHAVLPCPQLCECPTAEEVVCRNRGLTEWPTGVPLSVTKLDLSQNQLKEFTEAQKFPNLLSLNLAANAIADVTSLSSSSVLHLNISSNQLTNDQGLLDRLPQLLTLDMSKNRLSNWDSLLVTKPLRVLDISSNDVDSSVLQTIRLQHLEVLNISNNRLLSLPARLFQGLPNLRTLVVINCQLKDIDPQTFKGLSSLTSLDLSDNSLSAVDTNALSQLPNLRYIGLEKSKFLCDCRAYDLKMWLLSTQMRTSPEVTCYTPKPLLAFNVLTVDMSQFCPRALIKTTSKPPPPCTAPGIRVLNKTASLFWLRVNVSSDVTIELHRIGNSKKVMHLRNGQNPFFISLDDHDHDHQMYTVCASIHNCLEESCVHINGLELVPTPPCASSSLTNAIIITVFVMVLLYIPAFILTHRFIFILNKKLRKSRPSQEAPRATTLTEQYIAPPTNNNVEVDANYFNRSYIDLHSRDNIIRGKSASELSHYESRDNINPGPLYAELIPDSESSNSTNLIDLESRDGELVLSAGLLDEFKSPKQEMDRNQVFGNKYGTPHFNKHVPGDMSGPGNYEDLYDKPDSYTSP